MVAPPPFRGFDLFAGERVVVPPLVTRFVHTGVAAAPPPSMRVSWPEQTLLIGQSVLDVSPGKVDPQFRGSVSFQVTNLSSVPCDINLGDYLARVVIDPVLDVTSAPMATRYSAAAFQEFVQDVREDARSALAL